MANTDQAPAIGSTTVTDAATRFESLFGGADTSDESTPAVETADNETEPEAAAVEPAEGEEDAAEEEADDEEAEAVPAVTHTVTVDGQEQEVTVDELVKGYQRTADYTRKSQKVAEEKKSLATETEAVQQERARYAQLLDGIEQRLNETAGEPDWDHLRVTDPIEFASQWAQHQRIAGQRYEVALERQRLAGLQGQEQHKLFVAHVATEQSKLIEAIPEWKDSAKASAGKKALVEYGISVGFTLEELDGVVDHRAVLALYNAHRFAALQARKPLVQAQVQKSKVLTPGTATTAAGRKAPEQLKARQRLVQTGRVKDAADLFESLL